ncbi:MAG: SpoIIE family protein phosphatase [Clostridium sp.]|nr:SpoIIE family protein phosphatase [Clostridium sp.]
MKEITKRLLKFKDYALIVISVIIAYLFFGLVGLFEEQFSQVMSVASYLAWHNLFEFTGVLVSLTVFLVSYYTYNQTKNLRSIFLGSVFLIIGMLDAFHTLSYKGMPAFLIKNDGANRATTLWIISRMIAGVGFFAVTFINTEIKSKLDRKLFLIVPTGFCILILIIVTYYPNLLPPMFIEGSGLTQWKIYLEYVVILLFCFTALRFIIEYRATKNRMMILLCISLVVSIFGEMSFVLYNSVYDIYNYLGHIYKFIAFFIIFRVNFIYNIQVPYNKLYVAKQELRKYADNLDKIVQERTLELEELNKKLMEDLEYARDIQKAMFTLHHPDWQKVRFEAKYYTAERASGDFYNVFKLDGNNIGFFIGDVSGHGVPAAMLTVFLNQTIKTLVEVEINVAMSPSKVLESIYKSFNNTNFSENVYIVMLYAVYNINTRRLTYSSAGLNAMPILIKPSGEIQVIEMKGFPICKFIDYYSGEYKNHFLDLSKNDKILFYTDGLIEAQNADKSFFGRERLEKILRDNSNIPLQELSRLISKNVFAFMGQRELKDDITYVIMEIAE